MRYREFANLREARLPDEEDLEGQYDPAEDDVRGRETTDTRKPKLTLRMVNRLKKIRGTKNLEMTKKQDLLGIMYGLGGATSDEEI